MAGSKGRWRLAQLQPHILGKSGSSYLVVGIGS
jgi:hypothetical protein